LYTTQNAARIRPGVVDWRQNIDHKLTFLHSRLIRHDIFTYLAAIICQNGAFLATLYGVLLQKKTSQVCLQSVSTNYVITSFHRELANLQSFIDRLQFNLMSHKVYGQLIGHKSQNVKPPVSVTSPIRRLGRKEEFYYVVTLYSQH
jgi:hypothetical protein